VRRTRATSTAVMAALALLALVLPARAARLDPAAPGRFPVGVTTLTFTDAARGRTLVTEVWYPATAAARDATLRRGRFPLVLVAHGNCGFRTNYEYLTTHLAGFGFIVAAPDFPGFNKAVCDAGVPETGLVVGPPDDLTFLRRAFHDPAGVAARFAPSVRGQAAGLVGHSLGGLEVLNAALADASFTAVVGLAALSGTAQGQAFAALHPSRAVLVFGGTADTTVPPPVTVIPFFQPLPPPAFLVMIQDGTHSGFTDMDSHLTAAALERQERLVRRYATAFLERHLAGSHRFGPFLTARDAAGQDGVTMEARPR
jgi:predicted dienelactone hydrolase